MTSTSEIRPFIPTVTVDKNGTPESALTPQNVESAMVLSRLITEEKTVPVVDPAYLSNTELYIHDGPNNSYEPVSNGKTVKTTNFLGFKRGTRYLIAVFKCPFPLKAMEIPTDKIDQIGGLLLHRHYVFVISLQVKDALLLLRNRNRLANQLNPEYLKSLAFKHTEQQFQGRTDKPAKDRSWNQSRRLRVDSLKVRSAITEKLRQFGVECSFASVSVVHPGDSAILDASNETAKAICDERNKHAVAVAREVGAQKLDSMKREHHRDESQSDFEVQQERDRLRFELDHYKKEAELQLKREDEQMRNAHSAYVQLAALQVKLELFQNLLHPGKDQKPLSKREKELLALMENFLPELKGTARRFRQIEDDHNRRKRQRRQLG